MADSTADFTRKILVDVEVKSEQVKRDIPTLMKSIQDLTDAQKVLEVQGKKNTLEFVNNATQIRQLKSEIRDTNKYIDNTSKAVNAQTGTLQQNRALLSLMTADYVKLGEKSGYTAKQIDDFTEALKRQEKGIGQTYRNVGNYADAIREVVGELGGSIPGFQQFNQVISAATKIGGFLPSAANSLGVSMKSAGQQISSFVGFKQYNTDAQQATQTTQTLEQTVAKAANTIGDVSEATGEASKGLESLKGAEESVSEAAGGISEAAGEAAGGFDIMTVAGGLLGGALAVVAVGVASVISYFKDLDVVTDGVEQNFAGLKAAFSEFGRLNSVADDDTAGYKKILKAVDTFKKVKSLTEDEQNLADSNLNYQILSGKKQAEVAKLQVEARNRTLDPGQSQKLLDQATAIDAEDLKNKQGLIEKEIEFAQKSIQITGNLTKFQIDQLKKRGVEYSLYLQNNLVKQGKVTDSQTKALAAAIQKQTEIQREFTQRDEKRQNLEDQRDQKDQAKKDQDAAKAQAAADKAERLRQQQAAAYSEAEALRKSSANKILQDIYEEYGDRAIAADDAFNAEQLKLKKFLDKKLITQQEYNSVLRQITKEHESTIAKIIDDFRQQDEDKYRKASNELITLRNANIENEAQRNIANLKEKGKEQAQEIDNQNEDHIKRIKALDIEIAALDGKEKAEAEDRRLNELALIQTNEAKRVELEKQTAAAIDKIKRQSARDSQSAEDEANVLKAKRNTNLFSNGGVQSAELKAISDKYDWEISEAQRAGKSTVLLEQQRIDAIKQINDSYKQQRIEYAVQAEQQVQSAVSDIIGQGIQQGLDARVAALENQKSAELENTSLTATQKKLIDQKYQKEEDAAKLKAFKANQKLQVANALINGAVGITKTIAEMGFIPAIPFVALTAATTAFSVAKILSQKPAFAKGGVFESDGRGAVLPGYSRTDNTNARLRSGEAIVVSEAMRNPWARKLVSDVNVAFGGRSFSSPGHQKAFATGGIFTDGGNANRYYSQPVIDAGQLANTLAYQMINNFPPIYTTVTDIQTKVGIANQVIDRVSNL